MATSDAWITAAGVTSRRRVFLLIFMALVALVVTRYRPLGVLPLLSWYCAVGAFYCTCLGALLGTDADDDMGGPTGEMRSSVLGVVGLLLGVAAGVGVAVILVLRGISVSLAWVNGIPGSESTVLGFEAKGLLTVLVLFWTCAIGLLVTQDRRLGTGLFWCTVCVGVWTCLLIPPFRLSSAGAIEYTGHSLILLVCLTVLQCVGDVAASRVSNGEEELKPETSVRALSAVGWPGLEASSHLLGFVVLVGVCYHLAVPTAMKMGSHGSWGLVVAVCAGVGGAASLRHGLKMRRAMAVDLGFFEILLAVCALVATCVSFSRGRLAEQYPWLFSAMMAGAATVGLGVILLRVELLERENAIDDSERKWMMPRLRRAVFAALILGLLFGWLGAIWPRLPGIATTDDTLKRVTWGLACYLVLCLASLRAARRLGGWSMWMLCLLSYASAATFVGMRLVPFAPG